MDSRDGFIRIWLFVFGLSYTRVRHSGVQLYRKKNKPVDIARLWFRRPVDRVLHSIFFRWKDNYNPAGDHNKICEERQLPCSYFEFITIKHLKLAPVTVCVSNLLGVKTNDRASKTSCTDRKKSKAWKTLIWAMSFQTKPDISAVWVFSFYYSGDPRIQQYLTEVGIRHWENSLFLMSSP